MIRFLIILIFIFSSTALAEQIDIAATSAQLVGFDNDGTAIWVTTPELGIARFQFNILNPGAYVIWGKVIVDTNDGGKNSFYSAMNGGIKTIWDTPIVSDNVGNAESWVWWKINARGADPHDTVFNLAKGSHILELFGREANTKLSQLIITDDLEFNPGKPGPHVYQKALGSTVIFAWGSPSFTVNCSSCADDCSNCIYQGTYTVDLNTTAIPCGTVLWQWPKVTINSKCGMKENSFRYKFRGIRISDNMTVFQGVTTEIEVPVQLLFGEGKLRFEVACEMINEAGIKESDYATSISEGVPSPWLVLAMIGKTTEFSIEKGE
jgi:hypothetical protein